MSNDLSEAMTDSTYRLAADAKVGDVVRFTVTKAWFEKVPKYDEPETLEPRIFVHVSEDVRRVKLDKGGKDKCYSKFGPDGAKWVGKKIRGVAMKAPNGGLYLALEPE